MLTFLRKTLLTAFLATFASQASAMFIQPDWLDPTAPGVGTNRYSYSFNDPVNLLDPSGNEAVEPWDEGMHPTEKDKLDEELNYLPDLIASDLMSLDEKMSYIRDLKNRITDYNMRQPAAQSEMIGLGVWAASMGMLQDIANSVTTPTPVGKVVMGAKPAAIVEPSPSIKPGSVGGPTAGKVFSPETRKKAFSEDPAKTCVYCGQTGAGTQVDHAIPKSKGGNATLDNAQLACTHCNASKGARDYPVTPPAGYRGPWPPDWW